jgi:hypothetical protein
VRDGSAAAAAGLVPGCRLVAVGGGRNASGACSLADLKAAIQAAKANGEVSLRVRAQDPKATARAASHRGQCKAIVATLAAAAAEADAAAAAARAEGEAVKAAALWAANEDARQLEYARAHSDAFASDVLQAQEHYIGKTCHLRVRIRLESVCFRM